MEEYWNRFMETGKIADYLYYKKAAVSASIEGYVTRRNTEKSIDAGGCHEGEAIGKSDYTDWHGAGSDTDR